MKDFSQDFEYFTELLRSDKNFAYARYADGEVALMKGSSIGVGSQAFHIDRWEAPQGLTKVGRELLQTLEHVEDNYYYAISSKTDNTDDHEFLLNRIKIPSNITFANLWINANYQKMKAFYSSFKKDSYLVCNQKAKKESFPFPVLEIFPFPDNCVHYWEEYGEDYVNQLSQYVREVHNKTFFISCGPVSEIIIHNLYLVNPNNQYVDVGSSIDEFVHEQKTRPYMNPNTVYANEVSYFS